MTDPTRHPDAERGLTLVELMIVLVLVAVGVLTLSLVQTRSWGDVHETGRHTRALDLAQQQMESARALGFALAVSDSGAAGAFDWATDVTNLDANLRRVTVTVTWNEFGTPRQVRLINLLANR